MFRFEKLEVWQFAVEFADRVYSVSGRFPNDERFGLTAQMRRAAVSISSNIAEGSTRSSSSDFARFVEIAYGSLMEVISQSHIAKRQSMLLSEDAQDLYDRAERLSRMMSGLRASLVGSSGSGPQPSTLNT
jgi:four helix bundle protein